ncbi:MAG: PCYCGC motif-containing (lipo)protein [Dehalococcoidia bacterium]
MKAKRRQTRSRAQRSTILTILTEHRRIVVYSTLVLVVVLVLIALTQGGGSSTTEDAGDFLGKLDPEVREVYRYALERPNVLAYIPCYCGCENVGHGSSLDCFVDGFDSQGQPIFDSHGYG